MVPELIINQSRGLHGQVDLAGAKNAVLVIMSSLILTEGKSIITNVPCSDDVLNMAQLLTDLGAEVLFDAEAHRLEIDTRKLMRHQVSAAIMKKMRASILVMGPLLARFGRAHVALPGGCTLGKRSIDYHLTNFKKMGATIQVQDEQLIASAPILKAQRLVLDYPSVGATENAMMAATLVRGVTRIINAALEPEVFDLIDVLKKMGAHITIEVPATILIEGVDRLHAVEHAVIADRLEAGAFILAAAVTGGSIVLPQAPAFALDLFLEKLEEMGHEILIDPSGVGITFHASDEPHAVSFKTAPYPGFPTDLQAPMMVAQCLARGNSIIEETVFENRLVHVQELVKMGAQIQVEGSRAMIIGVPSLHGASVQATDIRAGCALVLAGLAAEGTTYFSGMHHLNRGYDRLIEKLQKLGALIYLPDVILAQQEIAQGSCALSGPK